MIFCRQIYGTNLEEMIEECKLANTKRKWWQKAIGSKYRIKEKQGSVRKEYVCGLSHIWIFAIIFLIIAVPIILFVQCLIEAPDFIQETVRDLKRENEGKYVKIPKERNK